MTSFLMGMWIQNVVSVEQKIVPGYASQPPFWFIAPMTLDPSWKWKENSVRGVVQSFCEISYL